VHWSDAVFCPAFLMQSIETAGPDGVREQGPHSVIQAMMPWTLSGLSLFPV
jgi:hypothetical protein